MKPKSDSSSFESFLLQLICHLMKDLNIDKEDDDSFGQNYNLSV